jgi:hypothetical protein
LVIFTRFITLCPPLPSLPLPSLPFPSLPLLPSLYIPLILESTLKRGNVVLVFPPIVLWTMQWDFEQTDSSFMPVPNRFGIFIFYFFEIVATPTTVKPTWIDNFKIAPY